MSIEAITVDGHVLTASSLGALGSAAVGDGVLTGCDMTYSNSKVTITPGYIAVGGRVVYVSANHEVSISGAGYIVASLTIGSSSSSASITYSSTAPSNQNTELNLSGGGTRNAVIGNVVESGGVTSVSKVVAGGASGSTSPYQALWESWNDNTCSVGTSVTVSNAQNYRFYSVFFRINPGNDNSDVRRLLHTEMVARPAADGSTYDYSATAAISRSSNLRAAYYTRAFSVSYSGVFTFGYAQLNQPLSDTYWASDKIMVPVAIYGIA